MAEAVPAVALLFDDAGLGEQLRSALNERGARIVHEGPLASLSRELLTSLNADVMVVNLDDQDDSALDRLDEALEGDRPRVVFNDAQASRRLEGWDRARWARHLAMKVLAAGDADPPRPAAADDRAPEPPPAAVAMAQATATEMAWAEPPIAVVEDISDASAPPVAAPLPETEPAVVEEARQAAASETLAAELEALMAADAPAAEIDEFGSGLNYEAGAGNELHDGRFGGDESALHDTPVPELDQANSAVGDTVAEAPSAPAAAPAAFSIDHLELAPLEEEQAAAAPRAEAAAPVAPRLSDNWALVDPDAPVDTVEAARSQPVAFGIEKMSAADFLAPERDEAAESPISPGFSLELVSMEEAIAPQDFQPMAQEPAVGAELARLVVLGATTESTASVGEFLAALPAGLPAVILHTQHLAGRPADGLVEYFASQSTLPVRLAEAGMRVNAGEVVVVPSDRQVIVRRDGTVQLEPVGHGAAHVPSIDDNFTRAAGTFGNDVVAMVFAGRSTDAVGGCQAIHDRGGQVWVEAAGGAHASDMVSGVLAERLSHYAGTPRELAQRLVEHFLEGEQ